MVVESPARLTRRSHKRQKDFHLTLRKLTEAYGYSFGCFGRGELIRPTKYLNRLMRAWAASRHP